MSDDRHPYTHSQLVSSLREMGLPRGRVLMLHGSVKAVGPVMGGPNVILQALLDVLGADGTLMMYAGWHDIPDFVLDLPLAARSIYYQEHPPFDPATARAVRENSVLAEFLRTWPGAYRSHNPEASMVAVGTQAAHITRDHPLNYGYGDGSPLEKLVTLNGQVLMLGAPLDTITLLHYAEYRAQMRHKQVIHYQCPMLQHGRTVWVDIEDFETGEPHADYTFEQIARAYIAHSKTHPRQVGDAITYLFDAAELTRFAIHWLESNFG